MDLTEAQADALVRIAMDVVDHYDVCTGVWWVPAHDGLRTVGFYLIASTPRLVAFGAHNDIRFYIGTQLESTGIAVPCTAAVLFDHEMASIPYRFRLR